MQPYFLPYIGYFQLVSAVDIFVVYDNIKYTKKGWVNRNRYLLNGAPAVFSVPLKRAPDSVDICKREVAVDFDRHGLLARLRQAYRKAPYLGEAMPLIEAIVADHDSNLFGFLYGSLVAVCSWLAIPTRLVPSSAVPVDHGLKGEERVLAICRQVGASVYVNAIGGRELYSAAAFSAHGIALHFLQSVAPAYEQFDASFVPWLSIVDVMMFNSKERIQGWLSGAYELVPAR